ncbi:MAG: hypothetical protein U5N53_07410 [Mycobacterium sp.]|nr:hypothetical protein [Mycobacterium sp.]
MPNIVVALDQSSSSTGQGAQMKRPERSGIGRVGVCTQQHEGGAVVDQRHRQRW